MLGRLCALVDVPDVERGKVMDAAVMCLNGALIAFKLEEWSGCVKLFVDVGLPVPSAEQEVYRYLLEQQIYLPAPFDMTPGLDPESGRVVLCAFMPLSTDDESDMACAVFLHSCVVAAALLKAELPQLIGTEPLRSPSVQGGAAEPMGAPRSAASAAGVG